MQPVRRLLDDEQMGADLSPVHVVGRTEVALTPEVRRELMIRNRDVLLLKCLLLLQSEIGAVFADPLDRLAKSGLHCERSTDSPGVPRHEGERLKIAVEGEVSPNKSVFAVLGCRDQRVSRILTGVRTAADFDTRIAIVAVVRIVELPSLVVVAAIVSDGDFPAHWTSKSSQGDAS